MLRQIGMCYIHQLQIKTPRILDKIIQLLEQKVSQTQLGSIKNKGDIEKGSGEEAAPQHQVRCDLLGAPTDQTTPTYNYSVFRVRILIRLLLLKIHTKCNFPTAIC